MRAWRLAYAALVSGCVVAPNTSINTATSFNTQVSGQVDTSVQAHAAAVVSGENNVHTNVQADAQTGNIGTTVAVPVEIGSVNIGNNLVTRDPTTLPRTPRPDGSPLASESPSAGATAGATATPSDDGTAQPSASPTQSGPTAEPTATPDAVATAAPTPTPAPTASPTPAPTPTPTPIATATPAPQPTTATVRIYNGRYEPSHLELPGGSAVIFVNEDGNSHTVTGFPNDYIGNSGPIADTWKFTFANANIKSKFYDAFSCPQTTCSSSDLTSGRVTSGSITITKR